MAHEHNHGGHAHAHAPADFGRAFAIGVGLNLGFVVLEAIYGVLSHSVALLADSGHNLSDVLGLLLAWGATVLAKKRPTSRRTYGFRSSSILAALLNALLLLVAIGAIAWESVGRFFHPEPLQTGTIIIVALIGVVINTATALLFMRGRKDDINIRGAFLHMAADAGISLGVVIAGLVIRFTGWVWLDPTVSLVLVAVIFWGTWGLLKESVNLSLHAVPEGINEAAIRTYLEAVPSVIGVHDLHIWAMSTTEAALTVHLVRAVSTRDDELLAQIGRDLHDNFNIEHPTIQFETGDAAHECALNENAV